MAATRSVCGNSESPEGRRSYGTFGLALWKRVGRLLTRLTPVNTAGNYAGPFKEQYLHKIATSVSGAGIRVGRDRGKPLRAWFIGGLGSLVYPFPGNLEGRRWQVQDFLPKRGADHHLGTELVMKKVSAKDLDWSLLCVGWMWPRSREIDLLDGPRGNDLIVKADELVDWHGSFLGSIPLIGRFLDVFWCLSEYSTMLEDVADLIAEDLARGERRFVGEMVGMKDRAKMKSA